MIVTNTFLPVDVIRAGISVDRRDMVLFEFRPRNNSKKQWYRVVDAYNGTKITLDYNIEHEYFSVKVSLPKLACGTNALNLTSTYAEELIELMNFHLSEIGLQFDFGEFNVSLLEVSHNYVCETVEDKEKYIEYFSNKNVSRKRKKLYKGSVVFENKTNKTTIYDKKAEVKNGDDIPVNKPVLDRTLRVEHKLFKRGVKKYFKDRSVKNILLSGKLEEVFLSENKRAGLHLKILHKNSFYKTLQSLIEDRNPTFQKRVQKFYKELNKYGEEWVESNYPKNQVRTYKKIMTSAGYNTTYISKSVNPVDFMNLKEEKKMKLSREERTEFVSKFKKIKTTIFTKVKEFLSLCLPCNFFRKVFGWFDTS